MDLVRKALRRALAGRAAHQIPGRSFTSSAIMQYSHTPFQLPPVQNVLIYNKQTAYEAHLRKGTNFKTGQYNIDKLQRAHNMHKRYLEKVYRALISSSIKQNNIRQISAREEGINILKQQRGITGIQSTQKSFRPDLIIAVGGDGTFLRASHLLHPKLNTTHLPIVGINSNPEFSEGRLCLRAHEDVENTIRTILESSQVRVIQRRRIKVQMATVNRINFNTKDYYSDLPLNVEAIQRQRHRNSKNDMIVSDLPIIALNDVFVGERASSMVSHMDVKYKLYGSQKDWSVHPPQKNSGMVACTGTGSTGWSKSINRICSETARLVASRLNYAEMNTTDWDGFTEGINSQRTVFDPEQDHMGITFREPIFNKISSGTFSNFIKASNVEVTSKLFHGMVSIDGSTYYSLPSGCVINLESNKAWAINCLTLDGFQTY